MFDWLFSLLGYFALISIGTYVVPFLISGYLLKEQDLKKKYNAQWAVVTGASSGIGLALVEKLAQQGLNVVMVALDDDTMKKAFDSMKTKYKNVQFRSCGVNLGKKGYMPVIIESTKGIPVQLLFNNAGFITTGFFAETDINRLTANFECNAACQVEITHHFLSKMIENKLKGGVCFTSSPANAFANPISAIYGSTKAFVTEFAASIAPEVAEHGIDVLVVHPSPVTTQFYQQAHNIDTINLFKRTGTDPSAIATCFFKALGRFVVCDQGYFCITAKIMVKLIDFNLLADIMKVVMPWLPDYKLVKKPKSN